MKFDVAIPRTIHWKDIHLPEWLLEAPSPPKLVEHKNVEEILRYEDGDVIIKCDNNIIARLSTSFREISSHFPYIKTESQRFYTPAPTNSSSIASSSK